MDNRFIRRMMSLAICQRVSDIYILPGKRRYRLLNLCSGQMQFKQYLDLGDGQQLVTYFKYRGNMAVSEHRRPQTGAMQWLQNDQIIFLRLSSVGDFRGRESLVIRLIYRLQDDYQLLFKKQWLQLRNLCKHRGMVIFAGPMGSGKTTTMYRLGRQFSKKEVVMSIEDPVEIEEPSFIQLQVNELADMDYESLVRVGLRHRPAVFIIGEIRDEKTAQMTVRAALSGHLVLATIHAQNTGGIVNRLKQLGILESYLDQTLTAVCYQRLLPILTGGQAVLFDLLDCHQGLSMIGDGMSNEWQNNLQKAAKAQKISQATLELFSEG